MSSVCFKVPPRSRESIERVATSLRDALRIRQAMFPLLPVVESILPAVMPDFSFEVKEHHEMGDAHGLTFPERQEIWLREDVYEGVRRSKGRDRFTLAHELGHLLLHDQPGLARTPSAPRSLRAFEDSEWQANNFAGFLLVPREVALKTPNALELSVACGVTLDAARVQLEILKK